MDIPWQSITRFGQQTMLDTDLFSISWILGRFCNYRCSYCWPYARTDVPDYQDFATYTHAVDEIKRQARRNGFTRFHWSFSGGEPTAYRQFLDLVKYLDEQESPYQSIHMTTNLSPGRKWWKTWAEHTGSLQRRSITASFHSEFARELEFGDKCLQLMSEGVFVTINQVMVPEKFAETYARCVRFRRRGINVTLKPQSNNTATEIVSGYTDEMLELLQKGFPQTTDEGELHQIRLTDGKDNYYLDQAERFNSFGFNQFEGWTCNAGYQSVIIRGNEVKRGYSCHDIPIGTLENFDLRIKPIICVTPSCVSSADSKIPKCK
jgi:organic radical activating enzyme